MIAMSILDCPKPPPIPKTVRLIHFDERTGRQVPLPRTTAAPLRPAEDEKVVPVVNSDYKLLMDVWSYKVIQELL